MEQAVNKKSLFSYLIITFGLTAIVVWLMVVLQLRTIAGALGAQLMLLGAMFVPALATFITRQFITREGWASAGLKWGSWKNYLNVWLTIPFLFICIFIISHILGAQPDWTLQKFVSEFNLTLPLPAPAMIILVFAVTLLVSPWINAIAGLGEEIGWRGHLLPQLLPWGEKKALLLSGLIWGLWHAPFVFFLGFGNYPQSLWGAIFFTVMIMFLGIYFGYLRLHSGSTILASWAHGLFNAQSYGLWPMLFPDYNPFIGGITGLAGIACVWVLSWFSLRLLDRKLMVNFS